MTTPSEGTHVVRLYDGFDGKWMNVTSPVSYDEALQVWNERTANGTKNRSFSDINYYAIFPADTTMLFGS